jgi:ATP-dependent helicase HrpB
LYAPNLNTERLTFNPLAVDLPITDVIPEIKKELSQHNTLIVNAPPGAGKSTLLPLALMNESWLQGKKILMLEPRRLAAKTIAARMSELLAEKVGNSIGYRVRFENVIGDSTKVEVITEGILTRMLQSDNALEAVGLVIFDEFHERSIHADVALALCRESQQVLRPDLKILVMSATLNMPELESLLKAPVVVSDGRQYPVEVIHCGEQDQMLLPEMTANIIIKATKEKEGDVLAFLPGQGEILKCEEILKRHLKEFAIHPLYGVLPYHKQRSAILPNRNGKRKIVLATSIAETSLTIEGVKIVVDSGFGRTQKFDPNTGLSRLVTIMIGKDSADQRTGRAGRLSAGTCYRMWSKATDNRMSAYRTPEILEADLTPLALELAQWGINDINKLSWLSSPPKGTYHHALDTLTQLNAFKDGRITEHGTQIHKLPCHPRLGHMMLMAKENDLLSLATDLSALLEERDPLGREAGININERLIVLRRLRSENRLSKNFARIDKVASSYRKLFDVDIENRPVDNYETGVLLAQAYPERIAYARPGNNAQFQLANGSYAMVGHRDDLAHEPWLAVAHMDARDGMGKIFLASPLNPKDLAPLVESHDNIKWDSDSGRLQANTELRIGSIILQSKPLKDPDEAACRLAVSLAIKTEGKQLLTFTEEVIQLQYRVLSLQQWYPEGNWPDFKTDTLLNKQEWIKPYLNNIKYEEDLNRLDLKEILFYTLDVEQQQLLNKLAPSKIKVPSDSSIDLQYTTDGSTPILSVRLQEVFGMLTTPTINNGQTSVLMHLLSPGFKLVQITSDLESFWSDAYFEVKKDLKRRYPKHSWPDNPLEAEAIKGVKRKK